MTFDAVRSICINRLPQISSKDGRELNDGSVASATIPTELVDGETGRHHIFWFTCLPKDERPCLAASMSSVSARRHRCKPISRRNLDKRNGAALVWPVNLRISVNLFRYE